MDNLIAPKGLKLGIFRCLKAGINPEFPEQGTCQGGVVSPLLANIALNGIEDIHKYHVKRGLKITAKTPTKDIVNACVRYADDMVFFLRPEDDETEILERISQFLAQRGLKVSERKTKLTASTDGFDFLGWRFYVQQNGKFKSVPAAENYKAFRMKVKKIVNSSNARRERRMRIFRATQQGKLRQAHSLIKLMLRSTSNILLAIRKVTQLNQGKKTAGIDGFLAIKPRERVKLIDLILAYKPKDILPTKRIYIPKANGKFRPLSIPCIVDRVKQAVVLNAWEPYFETTFESHSYGFRPGRSTHDAIEQVFTRLAISKDTWILDADIKGAFDNISHNFLLEHVKMLPGIDFVQVWLKAGYLEREVFNTTSSGVPQGGIISPLLANIALDGIEKYLKGLTYKIEHFKKDKNGHLVLNKQGKNKGKPRVLSTEYRSPFGFIRYADDFIITAPNAECMSAVIPHITALLQTKGLELNLDKTQIRHAEQGINYLGFNIRKYDGKTIIKPEKGKVLSKLQEIKTWLKSNVNASAESVINYLNPIIRGFAYYYRTACSKKVLSYFDSKIWEALYKWARKKHVSLNRKEVVRKYFNIGIQHPGYKKWDFLTLTKDRRGKEKVLTLFKAATVPIVRHVKVAGTNSKDDPTLVEYWSQRAMSTGNFIFAHDSKYEKITKKQGYKCPVCGDYIHNGEPLHLHHIIPINSGGTDEQENLIWMHEACHKITHTKKSKKEELKTNN